MRSKIVLALGVILFLGAFLTSVIFKFDNKIFVAGAGLGLLGALANVLVVILNNGKMPIVLTSKEAQRFKDKNYCIANAQTRCAWLADRFRLFGCYSFSIGDLLMAASALILLISSQ